jgi:hypothetical protein
VKKRRPKSPNHKPVPVSVLAKKRDTPAKAAHLDELLDEALEETFPASDPPSILTGEAKDPKPK